MSLLSRGRTRGTGTDDVTLTSAKKREEKASVLYLSDRVTQNIRSLTVIQRASTSLHPFASKASESLFAPESLVICCFTPQVFYATWSGTSTTPSCSPSRSSTPRSPLASIIYNCRNGRLFLLKHSKYLCYLIFQHIS